MKVVLKKNCFYCHLEKNTSDMQEIGVWVCNQCLEKSNKSSNKKTPNKLKSDE